MAELAFHTPSDSVEAERRWKTNACPELSSSVWQPLISHLTALITVAVVLPSALREFLSRWTPFGHFLSPHTSSIKKSLIRWKTSQQLLAFRTIDAEIISARMETTTLQATLQAFRSIHAKRISRSMESTCPVYPSRLKNAFRRWSSLGKEAISQSIRFELNFCELEKCAGTRFFIPSG